MSKAPAFQWYPKDADTDENVRMMDDSEFGFYVRCLNHSWINDGIPSDLSDLARIIGRPEAKVRKYWERVGKCFEIINGRYRNRKQEDQRQSVREFKESRSKAANSRWDKMHVQSITDARALHVECSASASASATASAEEKRAPETIEADFEKLYSRHPKKKYRGVSWNYLCQSLAAGADLVEIDRVHQLWCNTEDWQWKNGAKAPDLAQWLLDSGWKYPPKASDSPEVIAATLTPKQQAQRTAWENA